MRPLHVLAAVVGAVILLTTLPLFTTVVHDASVDVLWQKLKAEGYLAYVNAQSGDWTVGGNITPDTDATYDIGSPTARWNDVHLADALVLDDTTISSPVAGTLEIAAAGEPRVQVGSILEVLIDSTQEQDAVAARNTNQGNTGGTGYYVELTDGSGSARTALVLEANKAGTWTDGLDAGKNVNALLRVIREGTTETWLQLSTNTGVMHLFPSSALEVSPGGTVRLRVDNNGNVSMASATLGQGAAKELALGLGTLGTSATDSVQVAVQDYSAGDARLYVQSEQGAPIIIGNDSIGSPSSNLNLFSANLIKLQPTSRVDMTSGSDLRLYPNIWFTLGVNNDVQMKWDTSANPDRFVLRVGDSDGLGNPADVLYIQKGTTTFQFQGDVTLADGKVLKLGGGAPPASECDAPSEGGRLWVDTTNGKFYVCDQVGTSTGWAVVLDFSS